MFKKLKQKIVEEVENSPLRPSLNNASTTSLNSLGKLGSSQLDISEAQVDNLVDVSTGSKYFFVSKGGPSICVHCHGLNLITLPLWRAGLMCSDHLFHCVQHALTTLNSGFLSLLGLYSIENIFDVLYT